MSDTIDYFFACILISKKKVSIPYFKKKQFKKFSIEKIPKPETPLCKKCRYYVHE